MLDSELLEQFKLSSFLPCLCWNYDSIAASVMWKELAYLEVKDHLSDCLW